MQSGSEPATPALSPEALATVGALTQLRALDLSALAVGKGLGHLGSLTQLEAFRGPNEVDEDSFAVVARFTKLRALVHYGMGVTDRSVKHLAKLPLEILDIKYTKVGDTGAGTIGALSRLEALSAPRELGDAGLKQLARLAKLRTLDLCFAQITDVGVASMKKLRALESVNLCNVDGITERSVASLAQLPKLQEVNASTRFKFKGCAPLEAKLGRKVCM